MSRPWTAGPWLSDDDGRFSEIAIETPGYELVALLHTEWGERPTAAANARLISAAPDLYEALAGLVDHYTGLAEISEWNYESEPSVKAARAALAKALPTKEGGSQP